MRRLTDLSKPKLGDASNGCSYCCTAQPCRLAAELLDCRSGHCVALEIEAGRSFCGLVRRPAHYLFNAAATAAQTGALSVEFASMLGLGLGCDADDDEHSAAWALSGSSGPEG